MSKKAVLFEELSVNFEGAEVILLRSPLFVQKGIKHVFSTRTGGVSTGAYSSMNLRMNSDDSSENVIENYRRLAGASGFDINRTAAARQIHSDIIRRVSEPEYALARREPCDGLITSLENMALMVFGADCVPILLAALPEKDGESGVVAAVHSGWRGTAANIVLRAVERMTRDYSVKADRIFAAIGPAISGKCYQVDELTAAKLADAVPDADKYMPREGDKYYPDLRSMNRSLLESYGLLPENIDVDAHCTRLCPELLWSHRRDGDARGVTCGVVWL